MCECIGIHLRLGLGLPTKCDWDALYYRVVMTRQSFQGNTSLIRSNLLVCFILLALIFTWGQPAVSDERKALCWRDYPISTASVDYKKAFASETLVPVRILVNSQVVRLGMTESDLNNTLRLTSTVVEDWQQRTDQEQCEYLLEVLRKHPNSMHLYTLGELKWKKMSGLFRVSEWRIPDVGILRAFFNKPSAFDIERSYLYHLVLLPTSLEKVQRKKGRSYVLSRIGTSKVEWDIQTNHILIYTIDR